MTRYGVNWGNWIWLYREVEAETEEEAIAKVMALITDDAPYSMFEGDVPDVDVEVFD